MKIIFLPLILSILGHGAFLGLFTARFPQEEIAIAEFYLVPRGQLRHLQRRQEETASGSLYRYLAGKEELWGDQLSVDLQQVGHLSPGEEPGAAFGKRMFDVKLPSLAAEGMILRKELLPEYGSLFYYSLPLLSDGRSAGKSGLEIPLSDEHKLIFYIEGPVAVRSLIYKETFSRIPATGELPLNLKLRFWLARDGRVNQVIIEEGSGLPGVDSQIVRGVKKWRFRPAWQKDSPDYQWGVAKVRIQSIPIPMMAVPDTSGAVPSSAWDS